MIIHVADQVQLVAAEDGTYEIQRCKICHKELARWTGHDHVFQMAGEKFEVPVAAWWGVGSAVTESENMLFQGHPDCEPGDSMFCVGTELGD